MRSTAVGEAAASSGDLSVAVGNQSVASGTNAVAIGNTGDPDALGALEAEDPDRPSITDPLVRTHIEWARRAGRKHST